jgi:hypothetical protein
MTNTKGYRRGTRYMFSRPFKKSGVIPLSTYMKIYKRGDIVDIKVILCAYFLYDYNYSSVLIRNYCGRTHVYLDIKIKGLILHQV